jgi:hypothetical protein
MMMPAGGAGVAGCDDERTSERISKRASDFYIFVVLIMHMLCMGMSSRFQQKNT